MPKTGLEIEEFFIQSRAVTTANDESRSGDLAYLFHRDLRGLEILGALA